jgi:uncharacterized membrane protein YhaH (DUF805 family)
MLALALIQQASQADIARATAMLPAIIAACFFIGIVFLIVLIVPVWFICKKAGLSPWLSLLCLIPTVGLLVLLYVLAFSDWKVVPAQQLAYVPPMTPPYPPQT